MSNARAADPSYTVFIRLPFPRGSFVDPPAVEWDDAKEKSLWKVLSKASKNSDIDWNGLANKFEVTLPFLLQQAAWLYEQQLSQVRAQMRKVGTPKPATPPLVPGTDSTGTEGIRRNSFIGGTSAGISSQQQLSRLGQRAPSVLSNRKDSPVPGTPVRASAPPMTRNPSTNTVVSHRNVAQTSPRPAMASLNRRPSPPPSRSRTTSLNDVPRDPSPNAGPPSPPPADSSSDTTSDSDDDIAQSRFHRRPPRLPSHKLGLSEDADDEEGPAFLPFTAEKGTGHEMGSTLRGDPSQATRRTGTRKAMEGVQQSQTSDSSSSSAAPANPPRMTDSSRRRLPPTGPLSPRRTLELAGRSSSSKGRGREGSDGTPSMGSSFSDLDDASVTQSALEEALASNMQVGGMASRMSTISQALKSRYL